MVNNCNKILIIISGASGSGKTFYSNLFKNEYELLSVDSIKEKIFDSYIFQKKEINKEESNIKSYYIFWKELDKKMKQKKCIIVEHTFTNTHAHKFNELIKKYNYRCLLVIIYSSKHNRLKRKIERIESKNRHIGHLGNITFFKGMLEKTPNKNSQKQKDEYIKRYSLNVINSRKIIINNDKTPPEIEKLKK